MHRVGISGTPAAVWDFDFATAQGGPIDSHLIVDICNAVEAQDLVALKAMLDCAGMDPSERDAEGDTLLHVAVKWGNREALKLMVEKFGINLLEAQDREGMTPLLRAAQGGDFRAVSILGRANANEGARDLQGNTALMLAVLSNDEKTVGILMTDDRLILDAKNNDGFTALMMACRFNRPILVKQFCEVGAELNHTNHDGDAALSIAARECGPATIKLLLKGGAREPDGDKSSALVEAAMANNFGAMQVLWASAKGRAGWGVPEERRAFEAACFESSTESLEMLFELCPDFDLDSSGTNDATLMEIAVDLGDVRTMRALIALGANVNHVNQGLTLLMYASLTPTVEGYEHPISTLVQNGANLNTVTQFGSALSAAVMAHNVDTLRLLCEAGVDVNQPVHLDNGRTPLMLAASMDGGMGTLSTLLQYGADPFRTDNLGRTAFDHAVTDEIQAMLRPRRQG